MIDFLIIGGGIAGVSAAAELSAHGSVTLLETESHLGHHASGRSAAVFLEHYGNATVRALNRASAAHHKAAEVLTPRPLLMVARAEDEDPFRAEAAQFDATRIAVEEARALLPILDPATVAHAALYDAACDLDTDRLLQGYARTARANGARIRTGARVEAIERTGDGWRVRAGGETLKVRRLVDAAGAWADAVAAMAGVRPLGLQPYRRSMARLPAPGGRDTRTWPFTLEVTEAWYAKPDAGAWLVSPSEEDPAEPHDAWADDMVIAEALDRYSEFVTEPVTRVLTTWAGLRTFAPDRALVIGPDPREPDFLWCAGQGGYGFQSAPAAARLLAALATGRAPELDPAAVAALRPDRLVPASA